MPKKKYVNYEENTKIEDMDDVDLFDIAVEEDIGLTSFSEWRSMHPKRPPIDYMFQENRSKYTKSQLEDFARTDELLKMSAGLGDIMTSFNKSSPVYGQLCNHVSNISPLTKTADELMGVYYASTEKKEKIGEHKFFRGIAGLGAFKNWLQADNNFEQVMDGFCGENADEHRRKFLQTLQYFNSHCKAGMDIDGMLVESKYSYMLTAKPEVKTAEDIVHRNDKFEAQGYGSLDAKKLTEDLNKQGWFNKGSSPEHEKLLKEYKMYNDYMKKWGANADPEEKAMFLNDLRKSAEEYVSVKREGRWDNDPNWKPTSPSGEKRFDAALAIIDLTRQQLGMSSFSIADHAVAIRRYEKQKYAPKDFYDAVRNCLKGRRDQFEVREQTNKLSEDHERNEIAKLLNEGKPKTKEGVERVRQEIAHHASRILAMKYISSNMAPGFKKDEKGVDELSKQMREGKAFERFMAANKGWTGTVSIGTKSLVTSYELEREFNSNIKAEREAIKNTPKTNGGPTLPPNGIAYDM